MNEMQKIVQKGQNYEAPKAEGLEVRLQGVLCASSEVLKIETDDLEVDHFILP